MAVDGGINALKHLVFFVLTPLDVAEMDLSVRFVENELAGDELLDEIIDGLLEGHSVGRNERLPVTVEHTDEFVLVDSLLFGDERIVSVRFAGVVRNGDGTESRHYLLVVAFVVVLEKGAAGEQPQTHYDYQK